MSVIVCLILVLRTVQRTIGAEYGPYSVTWSEGALEGLVGLVPPLKILGKSRPMWHRFEQGHGSIVEVSL